VATLNDWIGSRDLEVGCRLCGWAGSRDLDWLSVHRDMNCPGCERVIILNTSEFKRAIADLRRQLSTLRQQLAAMIPAEACTARHVQRPFLTPSVQMNGELALLQVYRHRGCTAMNKPPAARRVRHVYR
jgi:hypothetical protein